MQSKVHVRSSLKLFPNVTSLAQLSSRNVLKIIKQTQHSPLRAVLQGKTPETQRYVSGALDVEVPVTTIQTLSEPVQGAIFVGIFSVLVASSVALCTLTDLSWAQGPSAPYIFGLSFTAAGVAHFTLHDDFCSMMPTQGAWGFWNLPGSASFHVNWTGIAELAGGLGLLSSTIPAVSEALPWLQSASALGLCVLSVAVTPSNIFMATHNAPGPGPKEKVIPPLGHIFRGGMQIVLWTALWGLSRGS